MIFALVYIALVAFAVSAGIAVIAYFCTGARRDIDMAPVRRENNDFTEYAGMQAANANMAGSGTYGANGIFYSA